jgi:hypothetical protein
MGIEPALGRRRLGQKRGHRCDGEPAQGASHTLKSSVHHVDIPRWRREHKWLWPPNPAITTA